MTVRLRTTTLSGSCTTLAPLSWAKAGAANKAARRIVRVSTVFPLLLAATILCIALPSANRQAARPLPRSGLRRARRRLLDTAVFAGGRDLIRRFYWRFQGRSRRAGARPHALLGGQLLG